MNGQSAVSATPNGMIGWRSVVVFLQILNLLLAILWPNTWSSLIGSLLFAYTCYQAFVGAPTAVAMLAPYIVFAFSMFLSLNLVDAGAYMKEVGATGRPSFAAEAYALYATLFLGVATSMFNVLAKERQPRVDRPQIPAALFLLFGIAMFTFIVYLVVAGLRTGFPLLTGTDRLLYRHTVADALTVDLLGVKPVLAIGLGICAVESESRLARFGFTLLFVAYIGLSIMYGDKFFILLGACLFFLMPAIAKDSSIAVKRLIKRVPHVLLILAIGSLATLYIYSDYGTERLDVAVQRVADRVAGQGQLWYVATRDYSHLIGFDSGLVAENLQSMLSTKPADFVFDHRLAAFFFVEHYAPGPIYASLLRGGGSVNPTMVFEAYGLVAFGYLGLAIAVALAATLTAAVSVFLLKAIRSGNPFQALLPSFLISEVYYLLSQATLSSVVSIAAFKAYAAIFVLQTIVSMLIRGMRPGFAVTVR